MSYGSVEASWAGIRLRFPVAGILYTSQLRVVLEWKWDRYQLTKPRDARNIPIVGDATSSLATSPIYL